jgi:hypothetical protein
MYIPFAGGTIVALLLAPRQVFMYFLTMAFVSAALQHAGSPFYFHFTAAYVVAVTMWAISRGERMSVIDYLLTVVLGLAIWFSDNKIIYDAINAAGDAIAGALKSVFEAAGLGAGAVAAGLAYLYIHRRAERFMEESPFLAVALVSIMFWIYDVLYEAALGVAGNVANLINVGVAVLGLYRLYEALRGDEHALLDAAIALPAVKLLFADYTTLVNIISLFAVLDIALGVLSRRARASALVLSVALLRA